MPAPQTMITITAVAQSRSGLRRPMQSLARRAEESVHHRVAGRQYRESRILLHRSRRARQLPAHRANQWNRFIVGADGIRPAGVRTNSVSHGLSRFGGRNQRPQMPRSARVDDMRHTAASDAVIAGEGPNSGPQRTLCRRLCDGRSPCRADRGPIRG